MMKPVTSPAKNKNLPTRLMMKPVTSPARNKTLPTRREPQTRLATWELYEVYNYWANQAAAWEWHAYNQELLLNEEAAWEWHAYNPELLLDEAAEAIAYPTAVYLHQKYPNAVYLHQKYSTSVYVKQPQQNVHDMAKKALHSLLLE